MQSIAFDGLGIADQDRQELRDAAHECEHGRLPGDQTPACGCWHEGCAVCATQTRPELAPWHQHAIGCPIRTRALAPVA